MAASSSPDTSQPVPEVNVDDASREREPEMLMLPPWDEAAAAEYKEKYSRYQSAYARRIKAKYFSKKALDGGDIFDQETNIDGEIIKSGRWPSTRSFIEQSSWSQDAGALPPTRKSHPKKSG